MRDNGWLRNFYFVYILFNFCSQKMVLVSSNLVLKQSLKSSFYHQIQQQIKNSRTSIFVSPIKIFVTFLFPEWEPETRKRISIGQAKRSHMPKEEQKFWVRFGHLFSTAFYTLLFHTIYITYKCYSTVKY